MRFKMPSQFWVMDATDRPIAASSLEALAEGVGIRMSNDKRINLATAAKITGFHFTTLSRYAKKKAFPAEIKNGRVVSALSSEVLKWSEVHKASGGRFRPRGSRGKPSGRRTTVAVNGGFSQVSHKTSARLDSYIKKMVGTIYEMSKSEFVDRVVSQALDRLKA